MRQSISEVFDLKPPHLKCLHDLDMHVALEHTTNGVLDGNIQVICGGSYKLSNISADCYHFGRPAPIGQMSMPRYGSASTVINDGSTLWVTGGADAYMTR